MTPVEPDPRAGLNGVVAGELRAMKARRQVSNEQISERSGIPLVSVNRYMAGNRPINLAVLAQLASALNADLAEIIRAAQAELGEPDRVVVQATFGRSIEGPAVPADVAAHTEEGLSMYEQTVESQDVAAEADAVDKPNDDSEGR